MTSKPANPPVEDLAGYEVLVCVCGGIAAYKTAHVVSELVQRGAGVTAAMTRAARQFITPLTFESLTGRRVLTGLWNAPEPTDAQHIRTTARADLILVAPATANTLARFAHGLADDIVSTLVLSADSPVLLAPAMNERMWKSPITQANVSRLKEAGFQRVGPGVGWLACRTIGEGRMAEPGEIVAAAADLLKHKSPGAQRIEKVSEKRRTEQSCDHVVQSRDREGAVITASATQWARL
jgi:phosphopantothenoylcysteine decarboxylase/phosphopantothenate--cysteine ligase